MSVGIINNTFQLLNTRVFFSFNQFVIIDYAKDSFLLDFYNYQFPSRNVKIWVRQDIVCTERKKHS